MKNIWTQSQQIKEQLPDVKILVLAYENTVEEIGTQEFIDFCLKNDLKDILLVGLKDDTIKDEIIAAGLQVSCYVQFHMPEAEIEMAKQSNGFVYLQAKPYETQEKNENYPTLKDCVEHLRACGIDRPIYCGCRRSCTGRCQTGQGSRWGCSICGKYHFKTA